MVTCCYFGISKSKFAVRMREKIAYWCMHFYRVYSLFFLFHSFSFLYYFSFSFFLFSCLNRYLPSIYGYYSYLYWANPIRFLFFTSMAHQPFLSVVHPFSRLPTTPLVVRPPLHLGMPSTFSLFHYPFHNRSQFVWFCLEPFPLAWTDKALGLSPLSSLACIKWSQPSTTYFGQRCHPSRASPKRSLGWKSEIGHFSPSTKPHSL